MPRECIEIPGFKEKTYTQVVLHNEFCFTLTLITQLFSLPYKVTHSITHLICNLHIETRLLFPWLFVSDAITLPIGVFVAVIYVVVVANFFLNLVIIFESISHMYSSCFDCN